MRKPLEGIRVPDLTTFVAAPVCSRLLSDLGAEVIKIEPPKGDAWRIAAKAFNPTRFSDDMNPIFDICNTGKKLISVNLKSEEGKKVFRKLLETTDVFVTNNRPEALKRLGIYYDDLTEKYPRLMVGIPRMCCWIWVTARKKLPLWQSPALCLPGKHKRA